jgi:Ca2+-binding RTX toxin-like protein
MAMVGGTITRVNTQLDFPERASSVTGLSDGGWVATWASENTSTGRTDVYQQAFNATGTRKGGATWIDGSMNGNDTMCGGEGNDSLSGGDENDQAYDGKGSDSLSGRQDRPRQDRSRQRQREGPVLHLPRQGGIHRQGRGLRYEIKDGKTTVLSDLDGDGDGDVSILLDGTINLKATDFIL